MKWLIVLLALFAETVGSFAAVAPGNLQEQIDRAAPQSEVIVPKGTWTQPLTINKPLRLRGESASDSILEVTSDQPAVHINTREPVVLESFTIRWRRATSQRPAEP